MKAPRSLKLLSSSSLVALVTASFVFASNAFALNHVDAFYYNKSDSFISEVSLGLNEQSKEKQFILHEFNAMDDMSEQLSSIETAVSKGNQPLVVNLVAPESASVVIDYAKKKHNPVVFFNRKPSDDVLSSYDYAYYVGSKEIEPGKLQGKMLADALKANASFDRNQDGVINLVIIKGEANHQDTIERTNTALEALREAGVKYKVIFSESGNWSFSSGNTVMQSALTSVGRSEVEAVICNNDAMALGAVTALQEFGFNAPKGDAHKFIPVVGIDGLKDAQNAVKLGEMLGTVYQDAPAMADVILNIASSLSEGKTPEKTINGVEAINKSYLIPYKVIEQ